MLKRFNLRPPHVLRMMFVEKNVAPDPSDIGLLGAIRIIIETDPMAEWVQQLFGFPRVARQLLCGIWHPFQAIFCKKLLNKIVGGLLASMR